MITVNYRIPSVSDVPETEVGIFRRSPAEMMRDLLRTDLELDETRDDEPCPPVPATRHDGQRRSRILTNGSLRLLLTAAETDTSNNVPVRSPRRGDDVTRSPDLRGEKSMVLTNGSLRLLLTAAETETDTSELTKKLRQKNLNIDVSQYLIQQKTCLDFSRYTIIRSELQNDYIDVKVDSNVPVFGSTTAEVNANINGEKTTKLQRLRRSLKDFKKRVARPLTLLTACFRSKTAL